MCLSKDWEFTAEIKIVAKPYSPDSLLRGRNLGNFY
jgi:hypothetical protein